LSRLEKETNVGAIFEFRQTPNRIPHAKPEFWIALTPPGRHPSATLLVGREFNSLTQPEAVAAEIRADLEHAIEEARRTIGG
jgi:hypothetical protein